METAIQDSLRRQLSDRQIRLRKAISHDREEDQLVQLLEQVDSALARMDAGDYARCLVCGDDVTDNNIDRTLNEFAHLLDKSVSIFVTRAVFNRDVLSQGH